MATESEALKESMVTMVTIRAIPLFLGGILLTAATLKIWDLDNFDFYIDSVFAFFPRIIREWITFIIPATEVALGVTLLFSPTRTIGMIAVVIMLCVFSLFLGYMIITPFKPKCDCFGLLQLARTAKTANLEGFLRNVVMLTFASWWLFVKRSMAGKNHAL